MLPLIKLDLPKLSSNLENEILKIASTISDNVSKNTIGEIEKNAVKNNDQKVLEELNSLKQLYGFDYLPQHRGSRLSKQISDRIRSELPVEFPEETDFVVQVINTKHTFIHDDGTRMCSFYYMMTDDTAVTNFYVSNKPPIYGTVWAPMDVTHKYSFTMKQREWHAFNHNEIHSVNDVNKTRIGMLIDMTRAYGKYERCLKHYENLFC